MKKNTPHTEEPIQESPLFETVSDLVQTYGKQILGALTILLIFFLLIYKMSTGTQERSIQEFLEADVLFDRVSLQAPLAAEGKETAYQKLLERIERHPELHAKYDAPLSQILLSNNQVNRALPLTTQLLDRAKDEHLQFYRSFGETTLLISQGRYEEALQEALSLQEKLDENEQLSLSLPEKQSFGPLLIPYQLLRIAMLHQKLDNQQEENKAWMDFSSYLDAHPESKSLVVKLFSSGAFSLEDYVLKRVSSL